MGPLATLRAELGQLGPAQLDLLRHKLATGSIRLDDLEGSLLEQCWQVMARPSQREPAGDWFGWLMMAGRGWGKTRTGAEWIAEKARQLPGSRCALVAPTFADGRDTMVEGESGLLSIFLSEELRGGREDTAWNRSIGELFLANGSKFRLFSSERPGRLRGPQHHYAWFEEPAVWEDAHRGDVVDTTWSNAMLGLRLGDDPRWVATTTPKAVRLLAGSKEKPGIARRANVHVTSGSTYENLANLARTFGDHVIGAYEGTRLGAQELYGQLLENVDGALWWDAIIGRLPAPPREELGRVVVAVDPQAGDGEDAAETGIVVVGLDPQTMFAHVLDDRSVRGSPHVWASAAVQAYRDYRADRIVVERNNGGAMVEHTIRTVDPNVAVTTVWASVGKRTRAEPVAALYEQGRVHHGKHFEKLEEQLTSWVPDSGMGSPDRMDALVWALTELLVAQSGGRQYESHVGFSEPVVRRGDLTLRGSRYLDK